MSDTPNRIVFPPSPKGRMMPGELPVYEETGLWLAQRKFNGQRSPVYISANGKPQIFGRRGAGHLNYDMPKFMEDELKSLHVKAGLDYWLDAELLDRKTKTEHYKDRLILFDVLHVEKFLFGTPDIMIRLQMLADICGHPTVMETGHGIALQVTEHVWMADTYYSNFVDRFQELLTWDEIEGLVLKRKDSVLNNIGTKEHDVTWMIRCRKPHGGGNYNF